MPSLETPASARALQPWQLLWRWAQGWGRVIGLGAQLGALAMAPSSYSPAFRGAHARELVEATQASLAWFAVVSAVASLVIIRIVWVTSLSYGLSRYALEMVVRVLVLELIPMSAALFVALRSSIANGAEIAALRAQGAFDGEPQHVLRLEVLPRVLAGLFAVLVLAAVAALIALVLAYLLVYGFTPWGFGGYTRTVGQVFSPTVTLIFMLKTLFLGLAVSLIPMASIFVDSGRRRVRTSAEVQALLRMALAVLVIEAVSLVGNYA